MMLSIEQKRQVFIKLRTENYQASLRLEGFQIPQTAPHGNAPSKVSSPTLAELKAKHVR